jgi:hypothetical protein
MVIRTRSSAWRLEDEGNTGTAPFPAMKKSFYLPAVHAKFPHMSSASPEFAPKKRMLSPMTRDI